MYMRGRELIKNKDFARKLAGKLNIKIVEAEHIMSVIAELIEEYLMQHRIIKLFKWLTLYTYQREPYEIQDITIPRKIIPKAKFGKQIKLRLNGGI